ncbi:hypothetical protein F4819DRAFT_100189 [Hypoxylon fuscum]|nr:hypothetical protein F4819DRAFT_100189 [Hypoxylon fuscum]
MITLHAQIQLSTSSLPLKASVFLYSIATMLSKLLLVTLLGSAALASPINSVKRDSNVIVVRDVPVAEKRDSSTIVFQDVPVDEKRDSSIVFQDVPVSDKRDSAIVFQDVPVAEKRDSNVIVIQDVPVVQASD